MTLALAPASRSNKFNIGAVEWQFLFGNPGILLAKS